MNQTEFAVTRFDNRNGVTSWRVTGWLHGVRIRKNFKSKEEAAAEKAVLEIKAEQDASGLRSVTTRLTNGKSQTKSWRSDVDPFPARKNTSTAPTTATSNSTP